MKQRVKFIFALMHSPEVLILDEPTSNLDDEGKNQFMNCKRRREIKNMY